MCNTNTLLFTFAKKIKGFSLGDELGFPESLGNQESDRRRAINYRNGAPNMVGVLPANQQVVGKICYFLHYIQLIYDLYLQPLQHPLPNKQVSLRSSPAIPTGFMARSQDSHKRQLASAPLMTEAHPLPLGVPVFKPIPKKSTPVAITSDLAQRRIAVDTPNPRISVNNKLVESYNQPVV